MPDYQICRLTPSLVASWQKDLHPDLRWALGHNAMDRETAEEVRQALESQGVPERWKFARKWYSKKHGAIFMLKQWKEPEDVNFEPTGPGERHDRREYHSEGLGNPREQGEVGVLGTA